MATAFPPHQIIVVGGGIAGLTAAAAVLEAGGSVLLLERMASCGGNSVKAASGFSAAGTSWQETQSISDAPDNFFVNLMESGGENPALVRALADESADALAWLQKTFNLRLSAITRLPGHDQPRTHRVGPDDRYLVGMEVVAKILAALEAVNDVERFRVVNHANVMKLVTLPTTAIRGEAAGTSVSGAVIGVEYWVNNQNYREFGPVIIATGGFCGDLGTNSVLAKFRPDLTHMATSNGEFADGRGVLMAESVGAELVNMENIQQHHLGLVDPKNKGERFKYLAAECLRGEGGVVLGDKWLVINCETYSKVKNYVDHYVQLGLMKKCMSIGDVSGAVGMPIELIVDQIGGGTGEFFVGQVIPVLHSSLGGIRITENGEVVSCQGGVIEGLFAAGEVAGGIFSKQRLLGTGLMAGVVFGRRAGKKATSYAGAKQAPVVLNPRQEVTLPIPARAEIIPGGLYTMEQVAAHNRREDCWIVVDGRVLDVTRFKQNHPGGELAILTMAGKDASREFNMIHAADVIDKYAPETVIGKLITEKVVEEASKAVNRKIREISLSEVSQHNRKDDLWVVINGQVLDVTRFQFEHPGGSGPIQIFAGRDASKEFNMIHPEGVIEKYAPECVLGVVELLPASPQISGGLEPLRQPLLAKGGSVIESQWWPVSSGFRTSQDFGVCGPSLSSMIRAVWVSVTLVVWEIFLTIFAVDNWKIPHSRAGLTRSAVFLIFYVVVHAIGNLHVFFGPSAFNGYAYFLNHPTPWGTLALPVEIYLLMAALMHISVGTIRTFKFKSREMLWRPELQGQLTLAVTGFAVLLFLIVHITQFRFPLGQFPMFRFRTQWMYPFYCDPADSQCQVVQFKDLYKIQYQLFRSRFWVGFYLVSVALFVVHLTEGWRKVVTVSQRVAKRDKDLVKIVGVGLAYVVGACYFAFPIYCYFWPVTDWRAYDQQQKQMTRLFAAQHGGRIPPA